MVSSPPPRVHTHRRVLAGTGRGGPRGLRQFWHTGTTRKHWQGAGAREKPQEMRLSQNVFQSVTDT